MTATLEPFRRILLPTDLGAGTPGAYAHAFRLALGSLGDLHVVHVHAPDQRPDWGHLPSARELLVRWGRLDGEAGVDAFERLGVRVGFTAVPSLELEDPIKTLVSEDPPDLLVLATQARKGMARLQVASVAEDLARHADVAALFVPVDARPFVDDMTGSVSLRTVVVPVGSVDDARLALREAMRLVESYQAAPTEFVLVHVGDKSTMPPLFLADDDPRWTFRIDLRHGPLGQEILSAIEAHDADLVVMATKGHDSVVDWLRGSRTETVVRHAACPVLAIPMGR